MNEDIVVVDYSCNYCCLFLLLLLLFVQSSRFTRGGGVNGLGNTAW